jgi:frataxin-like iron-binding protein CyaY
MQGRLRQTRFRIRPQRGRFRLVPDMRSIYLIVTQEPSSGVWVARVAVEFRLEIV